MPTQASPDTAGQTTRALVDDFLLASTAAGKSPATLKWYTSRLGAFAAWAGDRPLSLKLLQEYVRYLQQDHAPQSGRAYIRQAKTPRLSAHTVQGHVRALRACLAWGAVEQDSADIGARLKVPAAPRVLVKTLSTEQVRELLEVPDKRRASGVRAYAILRLLLDTGLRATELTEAQTSRLDLAAQTLTVLGKGQKERRVSWGEGTQAALQAWLKRRGTVARSLFTQDNDAPFSTKTLWQLVQQSGEEAGIPDLHPHTLRHTYAVSYLRQPGTNVFELQRILGHTSLEMVRHYAELADDDVLKAQREYSPLDSATRNRPPKRIFSSRNNHETTQRPQRPLPRAGRP